MTINIKTVVQLNGLDITTYSEGELIRLIETTEAEIQTLEAIKTKPKSVKAAISAANASIMELVTYMNKKYDDENKSKTSKS